MAFQGAKRVTSIHLPSLKQTPPEPITRRAYVLIPLTNVTSLFAR